MDNTTGSARRLTVTIYANVYDVEGRSATTTFETFANLLTKRDVRVEKDGRLFSPHRLHEGLTRLAVNTEFASMAVADIDTGVTIDDLRPLLTKYEWVAYSTHYNNLLNPDKPNKPIGPRFRIVFPLTRDVYATEWKSFWRQFTKLFDGNNDQATSDISRMSYLPSCPEEGVEMAFYERHSGEWMNPDEFIAADDGPSNTGKPKLDNEFTGAAEFPDAMIEVAATKCAQLEAFKETGGDTEPFWYAALGVAKHCVDGEEKAHEWGANYSGYSKEETQKKLDQWPYGPTTCEKFAELNANACDACAFKGKVKSPIQLGVVISDTPPEILEIDDSGETVSRQLDFWPKNFTVRGDTLIHQIADDNGNVKDIRVATPFFYPFERIESEDGTMVHRVKMEVKKSLWKEFDVPAKHMAEMRSMKSNLAAYEVIVYSDKILQHYYNEHANNLRKHKDHVNTFVQFGWNKPKTGFVIGTEMVTADHRASVRISRNTVKDPDLLSCGEVRGTKEEWTQGVTELYDRENGLPYQYALLTQFASPLAALMEYSEWHGIPLALTSDDSGYGKTTVVQIGINALCDSSKTTLSSITPKAIIGRASVMNHMPVLFDELTKQMPDPEDLADVAYTLSNGKPRVGMQSDGKEREPLPPFKNLSSITANKNFFDKLAQAKVTPIATQMRIFEIAMESYPKMDTVREGSKLHAKHHELAIHLKSNVCGVWADDYFRYIIENRAMIKDKLHSTAMAIIRALGGHAARERFYAYHMACVLVACWITIKIGALNFNITAIKNWGFNHIRRMRDTAKRYGADTEDLFSKFLADLHGAILVTKHYDTLDARQGQTEMPLVPLKGSVAARLVLGSDKERGKLLVSVRALDEWCAKQDTTPSAFKRQLANANLLRQIGDQGKGFDRKASLSKGVPSHPTGQCRCFEVEYAAAQGYIEDLTSQGVVLPLVKPPVTNSVATEKTGT